ncbi:P-loop containing nucleoside triphosphate hydrolase protein, partial [Rhizophagus irregularis]
LPNELSGGMRQRAALLRTILYDSEIILLDEPFGALDAQTRLTMQNWLLQIWEDFKKTVLFVTHDIDEAIYLSDEIYVLSPRPGR